MAHMVKNHLGVPIFVSGNPKDPFSAIFEKKIYLRAFHALSMRFRVNLRAFHALSRKFTRFLRGSA